MKRIGKYAFMLLLCLVAAAVVLPVRANAADVAINETSFPDKNFRDYVLLNIDQDGDEVLSQTERENVTEIEITFYKVASLEGIKWFPNLQTLNCSDNQITTLDLTRNPALKTVRCKNNRLTSLDLFQSTALTYLDCSNNQLTSLDLSRCTALESMYCRDNLLSTLDISRCTSLKALGCQNNRLTSISGCDTLQTLYCDHNLLTSLDLTYFRSITKLICEYNQLTSLNLARRDLQNLNCGHNQLTSLDLCNIRCLLWLSCCGNPIRELDISFHEVLISPGIIEEYGYNSYYESGCYHCYRGSYAHGGSGQFSIPLYTRLKKGTAEPPVISEQPKTALAAAGDPVTFSFTAATPREKTLTYQWYSYSLSTGDYFVIDPMSGETGPTLTVTAGPETDGREYFCEVSNEGGSVCTDPVSVKTIAVPKITTQPKAVSVKAGAKATFKIKAAGEGLKYQWYYLKPKTTKWVKITGATKATYSFTAKKTKNGYKYRCTVTNGAGSVTSKAVKLTVK